MYSTPIGLVFWYNKHIPRFSEFADMYRQHRDIEMITRLEGLAKEAQEGGRSVTGRFNILKQHIQEKMREVTDEHPVLEKVVKLDNIVMQIKQSIHKRGGSQEQIMGILFKDLEEMLEGNSIADLFNMIKSQTNVRVLETAIDTVYTDVLVSLKKQTRGSIKDYVSILITHSLASLVIRMKRMDMEEEQRNSIEEMVEQSDERDSIRRLADTLEKSTAREIELILKREEIVFVNKADWEQEDDLILLQCIVRMKHYLNNIESGLQKLPADHIVNYDEQEFI